MSNKKGIIALSPLILLIVLYFATSILAHDFYAIPLTVAFMVSAIYAIVITRKHPLAKRIEVFNRGAGNTNIMLMIWIFMLAGAFANTAKDMGCIDATVNLTLNLLPGNLLYAGIFLTTCIISISIGTSVGTIVALTPIAIGIADSTGANLAMIVAIVVGGSFFGDNLSLISDTTIVATSTQGCRLSDKFRVNSYIAMPVAIGVFIAYLFLGSDINSDMHTTGIDFLKIMPYAVVLITAIMGMNVMAVLTLGIILTTAVGLFEGTLDVFAWLRSIGTGITSMGELIIITMLAGGLLEMIRENGGIDYIIEKITAHVKSKRGAEFSVAALVSLVNICTANNTVAIITVGGIAKKIGDTYGVDNRKNASLLDTFSCCIQGIIPYGAQVLAAAGLSKISPTEILSYLYYPVILGAAALLAICFRYPRKYS